MPTRNLKQESCQIYGLVFEKHRIQLESYKNLD